MADLPILYSFRRCPYAMRARLAIASSGINVELREVVLRDKPVEMIEASPKATVPVLILSDGTVLGESLDVMDWALGNSDRENLLDYPGETISEMRALIGELDGPFKTALDRYKYADRLEGVDAAAERDKGAVFLEILNERLGATQFLFGDRFSFADAAVLPFVRQFAHVDRDWFWAEDWPHLIRWLDGFLASERFASIMKKYPKWQAGDAPVMFGEAQADAVSG